MGAIKNPSEKYFKDGLWTFDGTMWRPQNQLYAYRAVWREMWTDTTADAGTNVHDFSAVPSNEVWVAESIYALDSTTASAIATWELTSGGVGVIIDRATYRTLTRECRVQGPFTVAAGEYLSAVFYLCVLNDTITANVIGHKFKIGE